MEEGGINISSITITIIILVIAMILFFLEVFPISYVSMAVLIAFILTGILEPSEAFAGFTDSAVLLFMAMFIIGESLFVTGIANQLGHFVSRIAKNEVQTIIIIMVISGMLSAFLSNTGTAAVFIPIVLSISTVTNIPKSRLLMPLVLGVTLGGSMTLLGTPPNLIVSGVLQDTTGVGFGVFEFVPIALPLFIMSILYYVFIGRKFIPVDTTRKSLEISIKNKTDQEYNLQDNIPLWKKNVALFVLFLTVMGMVLSDVIGLPFHVIAWTCALILVFTNTMTEKEAMSSLDMQTIFLIVGTLSIGTALEKTGAGLVIAQAILSLVGTNPRAVLGAILIVTALITNFMSNTASAALLAPIGVSIALELGADTRAVLMAIAIGASAAYATPIGSPPNTMVYRTGGYKFIDYIKVGTPLIIINFIITMILLPIIFPFYP